VVRGPDAHDALGQLRVLHEAQQPPGVAVERPEPDVPRLRVVVGRSVVHDCEPEQVAVEGDRPLQVAADRGYVVQPTQLHALLVGHGAGA
jgi:hypothetical protein